MAKKKKWLVELTWVDIETNAGWQEGHEVKELPPLKSFGLLIHNGKRVVSIASTYDPHENKWADRMEFPVGCVLDIRKIERIEYD